MRLRAQIIVDIDARDYVEAAEHQNTLQRYLDAIKANYPGATLNMRERRERRHDGIAGAADDTASARGR
jgi:hypothetical protein